MQQHLTTEVLLGYFMGTESPEGKSGIAAHLESCSACSELEHELNFIIGRLREDAAFEPPAELVDWAIHLFQPVMRPDRRGLRTFIASLIFDASDRPLLAGVRGPALPSRQLLFRAGEVDVDIKIESLESKDRISLVGQVLSSAPQFFDNAPVKLESHGSVRYTTKTNAVGEFSFDEIPKDTYHLSVELPQGLITLFCVHRGNS